MPSLPRIFGWAPPTDHTRPPTPPDATFPCTTPLQTPNFPSSQSTDAGNDLSAQSSPADFEAASPASSASSLSQGDFQPDIYPEPPRRGDPSWIARPRNPFIIFRCEYSREHCKEGKRVRRAPGSQVEKTLSKRAAEAWHQLPEEDKNRFKVIADMEKDEHARMYPNYRFSPRKRSAGKKNKGRLSCKSHSGSPASKSPFSTGEVVAPIPKRPAAAAGPESWNTADMSLVKAERRRSASVPSLLLGQHTFSSCHLANQSSRPDLKRSRSTGGQAGLPDQTNQSPPCEGLLFDSRPEAIPTSPADFYMAEESFSPAEEAPSGFSFSGHFPPHAPVGHPSPLTAAASSLAGWSGEREGAQLTSAASAPWGMLPAVDDDCHPFQRYTDRLNSLEADLAMSLANYSTISEPSVPHYPLAMYMSGPMDTGTAYAPVGYQESERVYGLQEYELGLGTHPGAVSDLNVNQENAMLALNINDYFQTYE